MLARKLESYEITQYNRMTTKGELSPSNEHGVSVLDYSPTGRSGYYYSQNIGKKRVVLHFTAGYLGGDLSTLTKVNYHVSVPFVIARDGRIYRLFDARYWSYHLGPSAVGGNKACSSTSIGIELSNIGPLEKDGNWMWNYYGSKYCRTSENQFYRMGSPYRNYTAFATFTDAQYSSLDTLLTALCSGYSIPRTFVPIADRFDTFGSPTEARNFSGICSHVNYRKTGKTDIGPMFDWSKIGG